jgi:tetratricopeptide (TPR) repeat protein
MTPGRRAVTAVPTVRGQPRLTEAEETLRGGDADAAAALVIGYLRDHPDDPRGTALLGSIALKTGALVQAEQFLRRSMALGESGLEVQRDLAAAIYQQDRLSDALGAFQFLETRSADPNFTATKALILEKLGRNAEAVAAYRELVERKDSEPQYWIGLGHSLRSGGDTQAAIAAYRRAIALDPERGEAWWSLANIKAKVFTDGDIEAMEQALATAVDMLNIVPLHFALGRAWHDRRDFERAFRHFGEGSDLRCRAIAYDPGELTEEVDEFIRRFDRTYFESAANNASDGPIPVFLVSLPRSGSTLLEQMLDRHTDIEALGELSYVRALVRSAMELHFRREAIKVPRLIQRLSRQEKCAFGADYMRRASDHRHSNSRYFIDKMPMNWSDLLFIREILPQARFIEIRRDAMDCCLSNYVHYFSLAHIASFDLVHMARYYRDYVRLMDHVQTAAPGLVYQVRYERLIEAPEAELRSILGFLGLEWDEEVLHFHKSLRAIRTPSSEQVRRPLNRQGVGAWKPYAKWLDALREALGPLAA